MCIVAAVVPKKPLPVSEHWLGQGAKGAGYAYASTPRHEGAGVWQESGNVFLERRNAARVKDIYALACSDKKEEELSADGTRKGLRRRGSPLHVLGCRVRSQVQVRMVAQRAPLALRRSHVQAHAL